MAGDSVQAFINGDELGAALNAAILGNQSVKTTETPGVRGYDAAKKVKGRKRRLLVDTTRLLLIVMVLQLIFRMKWN